MTGGRRRTLAAMLAVLVGWGCSGADERLADGDPELYVSEAQSSAPVAGAAQLVVTIENRGDGPDRLVGADTDAALAIEIHRTVIEPDGRAYMRLLEEVVIPAGGTVRFRPGGLHLMVVIPDERVRVGGTFAVTLRFERSAPITLDVRVVDLLDLVEQDEVAVG
jgi:copper(I)-binding protein